MTAESPSPDVPIDRVAHVEAYPAEMLAARDNLSAQLNTLREKAAVLDLTGQLSTGVVVGEHSGVTTVSFGGLPENPTAEGLALAEHMDIGGTLWELEGDRPALERAQATDRVDVTVTDPQAVDPLFAYETPVRSVGWTRYDATTHVQTACKLRIYPDGYVEEVVAAPNSGYVPNTPAPDRVNLTDIQQPRPANVHAERTAEVMAKAYQKGAPPMRGSGDFDALSIRINPATLETVEEASGVVMDAEQRYEMPEQL